VALEYLNGIVKKSSIVFIVSDFLTDKYQTALRIASKKHDVIGVHVYDRAEYQLPSLGLLKMRDLESGKKIIVDTSSAHTRKSYEKYFAEKKRKFNQVFKKLGLDIMEVQVKEDYVKALRNFFKNRIK
jgi:choline kinase